MKMKSLWSKEDPFPGFYIQPETERDLTRAKEQVMFKDWDRVYIIDGDEGSGKSLLGLQLAYFLDSKLNLDRITFSGKEFSKAIREAEKNQCIVFDEAFNGLDSSGAVTKMNKLIVKSLMECRQKNLFIIIILPTIFLLNKYVAIFRSKGLFHVFATKNGVRGYYKNYNKTMKKFLYIKGKKFYSYGYPIPKKTYRFYGKYPLDEEEYRKKKLKSLEEQADDAKLDKYAIRFALMCKLLKEKFKMKYKEQIEYLKEYHWDLERTRLSHIMAKIPTKSRQNE